eukprot:SAG11_NODE_12450_length_702_cov_46.583748_1_plen_26_part_10
MLVYRRVHGEEDNLDRFRTFADYMAS